MDGGAQGRQAKTTKIKLPGVRKISIKGEFIRLDALMKFASVSSTGGEAKAMIQNGDVVVGGQPCLQRGRKIRPGDVVRHREGVLIVKQHDGK